MDGDNMKRGLNNFWRRKQYKIAAACLLVAVLGITGVYLFANGKGADEEQQQIASQEETEKSNQKTVAVKDTEEDTEQTAKASAVIRPNKKDQTNTETEEKTDTETDIAQIEEETESEVQTTSAKAQTNQTAELHFDAAAGLVWPVSGSVIMDYSMDQTVYFATLDQYKYNPAVVISGNVNDKVQAAASGKITDISTNEVTGCTVTMDIGDGYSAIYGQLKEVPYEEGAYIEAGNTIGFVSEPTKYYSLEGSNLYFELRKDDVPVDPIEYFQ